MTYHLKLQCLNLNMSATHFQLEKSEEGSDYLSKDTSAYLSKDPRGILAEFSRTTRTTFFSSFPTA